MFTTSITKGGKPVLFIDQIDQGAIMTIQLINLGTPPKGVDGDTQRTANRKMNENMAYLAEELAQVQPLANNAYPKSGGTVEGNVYVSYASGSKWTGIHIDAQNDDAKGTFISGKYKGVDKTGLEFITDVRDGSAKFNLLLTPPGNNTPRRTSYLKVEDAGIWNRAYGWLHDYFLQTSGGRVRGGISLAGTEWSEGTIQESRQISFSPNSGGVSRLFHRRNAGNYDEVVLRAEVGPGNWKDFKFRSNGHAYANGSWLNASDIRLKEGLAPLAGMRALLAQIQPIHYTMHGQDSIGYSAQELQHVLPDCVHVVGDTIDKDGNEIKDSLAVNYSALTAFNTQILKEQERIICKLLERVRQLEIALGAHETA